MKFLISSLFLYFCLLSIDQVACLSSELSVIVEPGTRECFHQYLKKDLNMEVDFQVLSGGEGLDINFWISSPNNIV